MEPLDETYFKWLYGLVASPRTRNRSRSYWSLLKQMHHKEFVWFVPNDDNRVEDGRDLRDEFSIDHRLGAVNPDWRNMNCSVFELLIGLSRRLAFDLDGEASEWFWHMVENLDLHQFSDASRYDEDYVEEVLERLIWRRYSPDGSGGLFPLRHPRNDQRKVELWYQLSAYILELV